MGIIILIPITPVWRGDGFALAFAVWIRERAEWTDLCVRRDGDWRKIAI